MIFLPIKPKFAFAIHEGLKRVEFRKVNISRSKEKYFVVYASSPVKKILGYFEIDNIEVDKPSKIWSKYSKFGAISRQEFNDYYCDNNEAVVLKIKRYVPFKNEIDPMEKLEGFSIPQSFCYLEKEQVKDLFPKLSPSRL